jgi:hypothetical protein
MTNVKLIIVEHLIKMHNELWGLISNDKSDDHVMICTFSQKCNIIVSALKEIAMNEH